MDVDWVRPPASRVCECPFLNRTTLGFGKDALVDTSTPGNAIYFPLAVAMLEFEVVFCRSVSWRERHVAESLGKTVREVVCSTWIGDFVANNEAYRTLLPARVDDLNSKYLRITWSVEL